MNNMKFQHFTNTYSNSLFRKNRNWTMWNASIIKYTYVLFLWLAAKKFNNGINYQCFSNDFLRSLYFLLSKKNYRSNKQTNMLISFVIGPPIKNHNKLIFHIKQCTIFKKKPIWLHFSKTAEVKTNAQHFD